MCTESKEYEVFAEEQTGAVENDSIYDRNVRIEDRFNCKIKTTLNSDPYSAIVKIAASGDNSVELAVTLTTPTPRSAGAYYNWYDVPNVNLENRGTASFQMIPQQYTERYSASPATLR